jgi:hypothetical protein
VDLTFGHGEGASKHHLTAWDGNTPAGEMTWTKQPGARPAGTITWIEVYEGYERRGVASALYRYAHKYSPKPLHAPPEDMEEPGRHWARAVGGPWSYGADIRTELNEE